jgi:hypothetical protein
VSTAQSVDVAAIATPERTVAFLRHEVRLVSRKGIDHTARCAELAKAIASRPNATLSSLRRTMKSYRDAGPWHLSRRPARPAGTASS